MGSNLFSDLFGSGHFAASFLSQDWSSNCDFMRALRGPLSLDPPSPRQIFFPPPQLLCRCCCLPMPLRLLLLISLLCRCYVVAIVAAIVVVLSLLLLLLLPSLLPQQHFIIHMAIGTGPAAAATALATATHTNPPQSIVGCNCASNTVLQFGDFETKI